MPIPFLLKEGYLGNYGNSGKIIWSCRGEPRGNISIEVDAGNTRVRCMYSCSTDGCPKDGYDYTIPLVTQDCYFGGRRYWYLCPIWRSGAPCNKKVGVLYMVGCLLGCRTCHDLAYESQQVTHTGKWGALGKMFELEGRLTSPKNNLRVKYWRGQPTKRYRKFLSYSYRLDMLSSAVADTNFLL